ncbi:hypothetical protein C0992_010495 [Termitomyces sp. T32_za158]|nr:hypothetical protein C0992_010495 [Termitomyces sp. T32_za158]
MRSSTGSSAFGQTLQFITSTKLEELEKQRVSYQEHAKVLQKADACGDNLIERVELLLEAVQSWPGSGSVDKWDSVSGKLNLANLRMWLPQAKQDPNFDTDILKSWIDTLEAHIRHSLMRFDGAKLFGSLFNEWIASGDSSIAPPGSKSDEMGSVANEGAEKAGRQEMHDQLARLDSIIFEDPNVDTEALESYLHDLFSSEEATKALQHLRAEMKSLEDSLKRETFTTKKVEIIVRGVLESGLMDESKRKTLNEILSNSTVLEELASVLTMRMASLDSWSWPAEGIIVEMRRHLSGKYRAFTDPDVIDAILLHHIGISWQVKLKASFRRFLDSKAWKRPSPVENYQKISEQLGNKCSIDEYRQQQQRQFFLNQLSSSKRFSKQSAYDDNCLDKASEDDQDPVSVKQKLLQIMATEAMLNITLHGSCAVVRSDLEWFGPSLPHQSILIILKFFGVSKEWSSFFRRFLRMPLRFQNDPSGQVRTRLRGTPFSYPLSAVCGEVILFVMDFAVNQKANGLFLFRLHDDLWLWDADPGKCVAGWKEMNVYADLVCLKFNVSKTGSTCVGPTKPTGLPEGDIHWGFLYFDPSKTRFIIDQDQVDLHIVELRRQLAATRSVFGWVNVYNKYMAFFVRNFGGRPVPCFGNAHLTDIISTLARIKQELFPTVQGGAVAYLRSVVETRFGIKDLPQGYFYLPISRGGLQLRHPMIEMFALTQSFDDEEALSFEALAKQDKSAYKDLKDSWDDPTRTYPGKEGPFMAFDEFISLRESWLCGWRHRYEYMLTIKELARVHKTPVVQSYLSQAKTKCTWGELDWYEQWLVSLYGEEVVKRFGSWEVVDASLIPVGMVQLFRTSRMKVDQ